MCQPFPVTSRGRPPLLDEAVILERALKEFARAGFSAMSVRALNAELGVSHETISKRFGSKTELFQAVVNFGMGKFMEDFIREFDAEAPADDLSLLRATLHAFIVATSRHPSLGELLHHESIGEDQRAVLLGEAGLVDRIADTAALLHRLEIAGVIHETKIREFWFLAQAAAAPLHFPQVSQMFDAFDGPIHPETHLARMTDAIMRSFLV